MTNGTTIKIATVKATGKRYFVKHQLMPKTGPANVDDVTLLHLRGDALVPERPAESLVLLHLDEVDGVAQEDLLTLVTGREAAEGDQLAPADHLVTTRRGNVRATDYGTPEQMKARQQADAELVELLSSLRRK